MLALRRSGRPLGAALLGALIAALLGTAVARAGIVIGALPIVAVALLVFLLRRPINGLVAAVGIVVLIPDWYGKGGVTVIQLACGLAVAGLVTSWLLDRVRLRLTAVDYAVVGVLVAAGMDWWLRGGNFTGARATATTVMPLMFYFAARVAVARAMTRTVLLTLIGAATLASLTVYYEFVRGSVVFTDPGSYYWAAAAGHSIFRPEGVFGSPPAAVTILSMVVLAGFPLLRETFGQRRRLLGACLAAMLVAGALTFTRAGWIGFGAGMLTYVTVLRLRAGARLSRWVKVVPVLAVAVLIALPALQHTTWFKFGVQRGGTLAVRESYWTQALPLITDSPAHLVLGHGLNALVAGTRSGLGGLQTGFAENPNLISAGAHNQYIRTLLEQGIVGLALSLVWLVGAAVIAVRRVPTLRSDDRPLVAGLLAATVSLLVVSLTDTSFRDVNSLGVVSLLTGLLVSLCVPAWRAP